MEQRKICFKELLEFGKEGERDVAEKLIELGANVVPIYQYESSHAPFLLSSEGEKLILPDLQCIYSDHVIWVEVKRKQRWISYQGVLETGCDYRNYLQYKRIADVTNIPVFIFFKHEKMDPEGFFYVNITQHGRAWNGLKPNGEYAHKPMYFWRYESLIPMIA